MNCRKYYIQGYDIKIMELMSNINRFFRILGSWFYLHLYLFYVLYILALFAVSNVHSYTLTWKGPLIYVKVLVKLFHLWFLRRCVTVIILFVNINPLSVNPTKWSNTQTIRRQFTDELFECLTILWNWRLEG